MGNPQLISTHHTHNGSPSNFSPLTTRESTGGEVLNRFVDKNLLLVTNQNHGLIWLISSLEVKNLQKGVLP
jgi:hypothetical protein